MAELVARVANRPGNFASSQTRPCGGIINQPPRNPHVKLVLLGEQGVGKSSLALRFTRETFHEHNEPTIGAAFFMKAINLEEQSLTLDIWDTAGQERYHSLAPMYYRGAQAAIVVYDVTCMRSYERALTWIKELQRQADPDVLLFLVGNKADIATNNREVATKDAQTYADDNGFMFCESSAKTGIGVPDIFLQIAELLAIKLTSGESIWRRRSDHVQLDSADKRRLGREQCC